MHTCHGRVSLKLPIVTVHRLERPMTIDEGMDAIPKHLAYRFLNASLE